MLLGTKVPMEFENKMIEGRGIGKKGLTSELFQNVPCSSSWLTTNLTWSGLLSYLADRISLGNPENRQVLFSGLLFPQQSGWFYPSLLSSYSSWHL